MSLLVDANGNELTTKKRRRQTSTMKKTINQGDILFKLIVDLPDGVGEDQFNAAMYEYFNIGAEAFQRKTRG